MHRNHIVADLVRHYQRIGQSLPPDRRTTAIHALAAECTAVQSWTRRLRQFERVAIAAFVLAQSGIVSMALHAPLLVSAALLLLGQTTGSVLAINLRQSLRDALDTAAGLADGGRDDR